MRSAHELKMLSVIFIEQKEKVANADLNHRVRGDSLADGNAAMADERRCVYSGDRALQSSARRTTDSSRRIDLPRSADRPDGHTDAHTQCDDDPKEDKIEMFLPQRARLIDTFDLLAYNQISY